MYLSTLGHSFNYTLFHQNHIPFISIYYYFSQAYSSFFLFQKMRSWGIASFQLYISISMQKCRVRCVKSDGLWALLPLADCFSRQLMLLHQFQSATYSLNKDPYYSSKNPYLATGSASIYMHSLVFRHKTLIFLTNQFITSF